MEEKPNGLTKKWWFWLIIVGIIIYMFSSSSDVTTSNDVTTSSETTNNSLFSSLSTEEKIYGFNEAFEFDDLEITIGSNYSFGTVDNMYSEYDGQTAVILPVTVTNLSSETHSLNMFYYTVYGSNGIQAKDVGSFFDDNIDYAGDLRSGASYTVYMHFIYDANGTYAIEFDNYSEEVTVEFEITK